jgi:phosphatidylinositol alpha-1,6-mannosyltransferase
LGGILKILLVPTSDWLGHPFPSRLHHIFEKLAEQNEIHVLRFAFYPEAKQKTKAVIHEIKDIDSAGLARYYLFNAPKHFRILRQIIKENNIDTVVISNLLAGYIAAKSTSNIAKVFDLSDHFPTSGAGYYFSLDSAQGKLATCVLEKLLVNTLKTVQKTVTCSYALKEYVQRLGVDDVSVLTNGVDEAFLSQNVDGKVIREKHDLDGNVVVGYIGSIEFWLNMSPLLIAMRQLMTRGKKVKLFLIGDKLRSKAVQRIYAQMMDLKIEKNVVWVENFIPYADVPSYIAAMDICTIPFDHHVPTAYYSSPNKLWEYLALGKPVIVAPIPDPIIQAERFVEVATTSEDYVKVIEGYIRDPDEYRRKACEARHLVKDKTWTKIAYQYQQLLDSLSR